MNDEPDIRALLLAAFAREGINYPEDRLTDAVEDCSHLHNFLALIRADAQKHREQVHDGGNHVYD